MEKRQHNPIHVVAAGTLIVGVSYGWGRYNYGLFLPEIKEAYNLSPAWLGLIGSLSYAGYFLSSLFTTLMSTKLGPRFMVTFGGILASVGLWLVSYSEDPITLTIGLGIAGTSAGLCYTPLSDVSVRLFDKEKQARAYAIMNVGTTVGVIMAGPIALWYAAQWREAWLVFAILSVLVTLYNFVTMPGREEKAPNKAQHEHVSYKALLEFNKTRLYLVAFIIGFTASVYWTFSVDLINIISETNESLEGFGSVGSRIFWVILGAAGCTGFIAGDIVRYLGLNKAVKLIALFEIASILLLTYSDLNYTTAMISAALFGSSFVFITCFVGIWAVYSFSKRPSLGFGFVFLIISCGQFLAPYLSGILAEYTDLKTTFYMAAALLVLLYIIGPRTNIRELTE
ncbi:MFS transporter [Curvivirga sp.]|uniref:MFS transporter n=1 Tax=Curvivirga sp. TaxID=2856848 RepID=UPI003B58C2FB